MFMVAFLSFIGMQAFAQTSISGTVTDANGEPVPGANVRAKGFSDVGTITDLNGSYSLSVPTEATTLIFSFVGMKTQEVEIGGQTTISISLQNEDVGIDEVVVTALGITRDQKALGYSVTTVDDEAISQKSEPDLLRNLSGKVAGVNIAGSSGVPGSATRITIRGNSSFYGGNQPLIVVDGIPYSNQQFTTTNQNSGGGAIGSTFSSFDPNNVKSINVLKGSAASALYGSRAANGVILIETKTGSGDRSKKGLEVTYTGTFAIEQISSIPEYQNTYGNGVNFIYQNANGSWGPRFDSQDSIATWPMYLNVFPEMFGDSVAYVAQPDNVESLFRNGQLFENTISIVGGNERSTLSLTASTSNNDGYIPHSNFKRNNLSLGGSTKLDNGLEARGSFNYSTSKQKGGMFGNNQSTADGAASSFARTLWLGRTWDMSLPYTDPVNGGSVTPNGPGQFDHPLWSWEHNQVITDMDRIVGAATLSYDITDFLKVSYQFGVNTLILGRKEIYDLGSRAYQGTGAMITDNVKSTELESNLLVTFEKDLSSDMNLKVIVGHNVNQRETDRQSIVGTQFITGGIFDMDNLQNVVPNGGIYTKRRLMGLLYDISFGYKRFLFINASGRNDWSSTLPKDKNNFFYPAFSASFIFTDAFDLQNNILSFGKLRGGWAMSGNDAAPYSLEDTYTVRTTGFPFLGQPAMGVPNTTYSPDLNPEFTNEVELGIDLAFLNRRIGLDFTWYDRKTRDQIVNITIPASTGYRGLVTNSGEIINTGFELGLNLIPIRDLGGFTWDIYTTFTQNTSSVLALPEGYDRMVLAGIFGDPQPVFEVGQPYGIFRGSVAARDDEGNLLIDAGTGVLITAPESATIGNPNPDYIIGLTNTFSWKGLVISAHLSLKKGGDVFSNSLVSLLGRGVTKDTEDREHSYVIPGYYGDPNTYEPVLDDSGNQIPNTTQIDMNALYFGNSFGINGISEFQIYDGTVFRLSQVSIGYELPKSLFEKTPIGSLFISVTGNNLLYYAPNIPKYTNIDPEFNAYGATNVQGMEYTVAPSVRRFGFSLKATF